MTKADLEKENAILKDKIERMVEVVEKDGRRLSMNAYSIAIGKSIMALYYRIVDIRDE